ncbi:hypothetical protein HDC93_007360 [Streptomyces sp. AK010]|nr:hypothetical protein [Streptomyces sp. AK010]
MVTDRQEKKAEPRTTIAATASSWSGFHVEIGSATEATGPS